MIKFLAKFMIANITFSSIIVASLIIDVHTKLVKVTSVTSSIYPFSRFQCTYMTVSRRDSAKK